MRSRSYQGHGSGATPSRQLVGLDDVEQRNDADLFEILASFYQPDRQCSTAIEYEQLLALSPIQRYRGLKKLRDSGKAALGRVITQSWDHGGVIRQVFRTKQAVMGLTSSGREAGGGLLRKHAELHSLQAAYGKLQAHCNTIQASVEILRLPTQ